MRELDDPEKLAAALVDARDYTLATYAHLSPQALRFPYLPTVNPPLWEFAHVAWFQEHWCLRWQEGAVRTASRLPDADPMLNSALIPHRNRWDLPPLNWQVVHDYMARVLEATIERLERSPPADPYFFLLALFHEDMHAEAYRMSLQTLALPGPVARHAAVPSSLIEPAAREVSFAGGPFVLGAPPGPDFVFDNEEEAHEVFVQPFALATTTVTQGEYRQFVEAGGYGDRRWWSGAGWSWRERLGAVKPRDWVRDGASWLIRRFDVLEPLVDAAAMVHVTAYEAEAYAAFAGARLPSEAEWEYAARAGWDATQDRFPWGAAPLTPGAVNLDDVFGRPVASAALPGSAGPSGLRQLLGNVWEWTSSPFLPYPGFAPGPYREYSQPWFGDHQVLRGGSFATRSRLVHNRWRNFYKPDRNDAFAGIRLARGV